MEAIVVRGLAVGVGDLAIDDCDPGCGDLEVGWIGDRGVADWSACTGVAGVLKSDDSCTDNFDTVVDAGVSSDAGGEGDCRVVVDSAGNFRFFRDIVVLGSVDTMGVGSEGDDSFVGVSGAGSINVVSIGVGNGDIGPGKYFEVSLTGLERRLRGLPPEISFFSLLSFFVLISESVVDSSLLVDSAPRFLSISMVSVSSEAAVVGVVLGDAI